MSEIYILGIQSTSTSIPTIDISSAIVTLGSSITYNGSEQTQSVTSVVVNGTTLTAGTDYTITDNTGTNAGSYTLTIVGQGAYSGAKSVSWSIGRATGSISVSPSSLSIIGANNTATSTITVVGDGNVSVGTSASDVAIASVSGNTVTVTSVGAGSATITVTLGAGTNYIGDSATISVSVVVISSTLANCTPAEIQIAAQQDIGASLWSVGAKTAAISFQNVTVGKLSFNGLSACAFILGFDHNAAKEGNGIHFQMGMTTSGTKIAFCDGSYGSSGSGAMFHMNSSNNNYGGWNSSYMRSTICPTFLTALPTAWQNVIASTTKYTDNTGGGSDTASYVTTTSDKIWLLAEFEVNGARNSANSTEQNYQQQYTYYKNGNSKVFCKHNATTTACYWLLRSPYYGYSSSFCFVTTSGIASSGNARYSYGFAPGFRVA